MSTELEQQGVPYPFATNSTKRRQPLASLASSDVTSTNTTSNVQPVVIHSEKDLEQEFDNMRELLKDKKSDWKKRVDSLQHLQALVHGGAIHHDNFIPLLNSLKDALSVQLQELRSSVVRECCTCLNVLVKVLRDRFEPFGDFFLPHLFKLTVVTIQVMSDSSNHCIRTIITHTRLTKTIPLILENASSRKSHGTLRTRCTEYILLLLEESSQGYLEKTIDQMVATIQLCLADSSPEVRSTARKCYLTLARSWPDKASKLFATLDSATQRQISRDEESSSKSAQDDKSKTKAAEGKRLISKVTRVKRPKIRVDNFLPANGAQDSETSNLTLVSNGSKTPVDQENYVQTARQKPGAFSVPHHLLSRVNGIRKVTKVPTPVETPRVEVDLMLDDADDVISESVKTGNGVPSNTAKPVIGEQLVSSDTVDMMDTNEDFTYSSESIPSILSELNHSDWNVRISACDKLIAITGSPRRNEITIHFDKIMIAMLDRITDKHYRVVNRSMQCLFTLIPVFQQYFEQYLERVLSKLLLRLTDPKEKLRKLTEQILLEIGNNYTAETLLPVLLKVSDNSNSKIQLACLEYILHITPNATTYLSYPSHMRAAMAKMVSILSNKKAAKSCETAAIALLLSLYKLHPRLFLEQIILLPLNEQVQLKKSLEPKIPDLDSEIANVSKTRIVRRNSSGSMKSDIVSKVSPTSSPTHSSENTQVAEMRRKTTGDSNLVIPTRVLEKFSKQSSGQATTTLRSYRPDAKKIEQTRADAFSRVFNQIITQCNSPKLYDEATKTINEMITLVKERENNNWDLTIIFAKLLFKIMELIHHEYAAIRAISLCLLQELLSCHSIQFDGYADITLKKIMQKYTDTVPEVFHAAVSTSQYFCDIMDPLKTIEVLKSLIINNQLISSSTAMIDDVSNDPRDAVLLGSIRLLSRLVTTRMAEDAIRLQVPGLLPGLVDSMNHRNADIRKAVVYVLVDLFDILGPSFRANLANSLNESQIKLVTMYLKERKNKV